MRGRLRAEVDVAVPADRLWDYLTDWPRQGEWLPLTRVERVDAADGLGGRFRAWTGLGPVGFWDPMTITAWERDEHGGGRCEVLHRGPVVRGDGELAVLSCGAGRSTFRLTELVVVPGGPLGALAWRLARPAAERLAGWVLRRMRDRLTAGP